jgi:hypothetical protein
MASLKVWILKAGGLVLSVSQGCSVSSAGRVITGFSELAMSVTKPWQVGPVSRGLVLAMLAAPVRSTLDLARRLALAAHHHHSASLPVVCITLGDCFSGVHYRPISCSNSR